MVKTAFIAGGFDFLLWALEGRLEIIYLLYDLNNKFQIITVTAVFVDHYICKIIVNNEEKLKNFISDA